MLFRQASSVRMLPSVSAQDMSGLCRAVSDSATASACRAYLKAKRSVSTTCEVSLA